jgi:hypothetical protein
MFIAEEARPQVGRTSSNNILKSPQFNALLRELPATTLSYIPRKSNKEADLLTNFARTTRHSLLGVTFPTFKPACLQDQS